MRTKIVIGAVIIAGAVALFFLSGGVSSGKVFYMTPDEFVRSSNNNGERVRLTGRVEIGSVKLPAGKQELFFMLEDDKAKIPVHYKGNVPESFAEGRDIVAEGRMGDSFFEAKEIIVKCPSKYESILKEKKPEDK
ncbi:MAG: cytochrome c maturation protein CcmE [Acidobacteria bacterium]|nr:cytochrome c maturation protein CcmE [Acidobacteriota bacterium]